MNTVSDLGEFGLIERLSGLLANPQRDDLIVGIGDDAAVWKLGSEYVIATTDTMVEGVHFVRRKPHKTYARLLGYKVLAVNLSDIAAMGGVPLFALVTLQLPPTTSSGFVDELYAGIAECAKQYSVSIVGGDTVRSSEVSITVSLIGKAQQLNGQPLLLRRDGARVGDSIGVTNFLGDSAAGLSRFLGGANRNAPFVVHFLKPKPQLHAGQLAAQMGVRCGIDVSDGLLQDIGHICSASQVGAVVLADNIPMRSQLRKYYPEDALKMACTGGEDYELVLAGPQETLKDLRRPENKVHLGIIGEIVDDPDHRVRLLDDAGHEVTFDRPGWDAFR